jgi:catalase
MNIHTPALAAAACAAACACAPVQPVQPAGPASAAPTPQALVDAFESVSGTHPGLRRGGAKGLCAQGHFTGTADGRALSSAAAFSGEPVPVVARWSITGGNPKVSDKAKTTRGLALQLTLPGGERWQMANISAPVNSVSTPDVMLRSLQARQPDPQTKKPDPAKLKAFGEAYPETKAQADWIASHGVPASYAAVNYWGVHAFRFTDAKGQARYARWVFEPVGGQELLDEDKLKSMPDEFLADEVRQRVAARPAEFQMKLQLAEAGDNLLNPTVMWPEGRKTVTVGRLVLDKVESGPGGACDRVVFDPNVLPRGISPSDDPVLRARSAAYAVSAGRRLAGQ